MTLAAAIPRPGTQVLQQFRATTATVITPLLVPCIIGVCRQIVDPLVTSATGGQLLNADALVQMPGFFITKPATGVPPVYTGLDGLSLVFSVNNGAAVTVLFSDPAASGLTPATVVGQINDALVAADVTSVVAVLVDSTRLRLQTVGLGEFQSIYVETSTASAVAAALGVGLGKTYVGLGENNNLEVVIPPESFPDPRGNLSELSFDTASIRAFLSTGTGVSLFEARRTESFLRSGIVDDPAEFTSILRTDPVIVYPTAFYGLTLIVSIDGGAAQTYTFPAVGAAPTNADAVASMLTAGISGLTVEHNAGVLTYTSTSTGYSARIVIGSSSTALGLLGLTGTEDVRGVAIEAADDGNGDATTSLLDFAGEDFTLPATQGVLTAASAPDFASLSAGMTLVISDGQQAQEVAFTGTEVTVAGVANSLQATIEAVMGSAAGGRLAVSDSGGNLRITNTGRYGDESLVRIIGGTALHVLDRGTTAAVTTQGSVTLNPDTAATATGSAALAVVQAAAAGQTVSVEIDNSGVPVMVSVGTAGVDHTDVPTFIVYLDAQLGVQANITQAVGGGVLITTVSTGATAQIELIEGTGALALFGLAAGTTNGADVFPTIGTQTFQVSIDGGIPITVTLASETTFAALKANIEGAVTSVTATQGSGVGGLVLTRNITGSGGSISIINNGGGGTTVLGLTVQTVYGSGELIYAGAEARGRQHPPIPGDDLYIDGVQYGEIYKVAPGGVANRLRISRQVVISANVGSRFFVQAKNLTGPNSLQRPSADLQVDLQNNVIMKHSMMRDFAGNVVNTRAPVYLSYSAVRQDTTALASNPGLLRFDDTTQLEAALAPINPDNPLALGLFYALINAPGAQVMGLGVDATTADSPDGTVEAFTRAAEFLEGHEVYALAPLTQDDSVMQVFNTHVSYMSEPAQRGERVVLCNVEAPTRALDTLVASGTRGDVIDTITFDTKVVSLSALLQNAGVSPVGLIPASAGVFLDIASDAKRYSVKGVSGSRVTVRVTPAEFPLGSNDDDFYAESTLPVPLVTEIFSVRVRGQALVTVDGQVDKNAVAGALNELGQSFGNRRFWMTFPGQCRARIEGVEQLIKGYYMNAATTGAIAQQPPQQSMTCFPISGFTGVVGSNDTFSEPQLDLIAGGGAYIFIQEGASTPIFSRMALTTDVSSLENRTDSVTKVVDFTAKFVRTCIRTYIGKFNISQGFLDTLGTLVHGLFGLLTEIGVLIGGTLDNIIQDADNRDTVLIDATLDVPIPCNYIKLVLLV